MARPTLPAEAPSRQGWRPSLVNTASALGTLVTDGPLATRQAIEYDQGPPTYGTGSKSYNPCSQPGTPFTAIDESLLEDPLKWTPFGIARYADCPVLGASSRYSEVSQRARRELQAFTSHDLEKVAFTGDLDTGTSIETMAAADGTDNRRIASASATLIDNSIGHDLVQAIGLINEWVADVIGPYRAWIHASPRIAPFLSFYGLAQRNGNVLETVLADHYFVLGTGYTTEGPGGASVASEEAWLYVTLPARVLLGPIVPTEDGDPRVTMNREGNRVHAMAHRLVSVDFDTSAHGAIKVCLPAPGPACN